MMAAKNILDGRGIENRLEAAPLYFYDYFDQLLSLRKEKLWILGRGLYLVLAVIIPKTRYTNTHAILAVYSARIEERLFPYETSKTNLGSLKNKKV